VTASVACARESSGIRPKRSPMPVRRLASLTLQSTELWFCLATRITPRCVGRDLSGSEESDFRTAANHILRLVRHRIPPMSLVRVRLVNVRRVLTYAVMAGALTACCGCGANASHSSLNATSTTNSPPATIQAAATAWSKAYLTGTVADIQAMEGYQCSNHPSLSPAVLSAYLNAERAALANNLGTPVRMLRITGVLTRNVTATQGEAEVQYNLPAARVGNDSWVSYQIQNGRWKETNCHAPIGGV